MASVPYAFNERENQGIRNSKNGIGDISVNGYYRLFNDKRTVFTKKILVQSLWICAGIKLPTGKYTPADKLSSTQNTNLFQLGTASFDFSVNAMYEVRIQDAGLNISASYKMNTANKYSYNYGNKLNATAQLYYKIRVKNKFTIAPNAGVMYENSKKDIDNKISVDASGGNLMLGSIGFETGFKKITFGANWQIPLSQNLANGFVNANPRMMVHISFFYNFKNLSNEAAY
ncbi:MAG: transporter [Chitinophagaceae bacterium]|nr:transporter [Chitinophagaceae bacterium]